MADNSPKPLVIPGASAIANSGQGECVVSRMVSETLDFARRQNALRAPRMFRLGEYELREPDYRQICKWARQLGLDPEAFLGELSLLEYQDSDGRLWRFRIQNGAIIELFWDGEKYPIRSFAWEEGLVLEVLRIENAMPYWRLSSVLPLLRELAIFQAPLSELDLSRTPKLRALSCVGNGLVELDLSPVTGLIELNCSANELTGLDLTPVSDLEQLSCADNLLTALDLSPVRRLRDGRVPNFV